MTEPVLTVNLLISIGLFGVAWCIWYILILDNNEEKNTSSHYDDKTSDE